MLAIARAFYEGPLYLFDIGRTSQTRMGCWLAIDFEKCYQDYACGQESRFVSLTSLDIERLFNERRVLTLHVARLVRSQELAADLVQEAFAKLSSLVGKQTVVYPRGLLYRTAINLAIDHLRSKPGVVTSFSDSEIEEVALQVPALTPGADRALAAKQQLDRVNHAIHQLPPRTRHAFLLHRVHGYSYPEIAGQLAISESAVQKLITRALKQCWTSLELLDLD